VRAGNLTNRPRPTFRRPARRPRILIGESAGCNSGRRGVAASGGRVGGETTPVTRYLVPGTRHPTPNTPEPDTRYRYPTPDTPPPIPESQTRRKIPAPAHDAPVPASRPLSSCCRLVDLKAAIEYHGLHGWLLPTPPFPSQPWRRDCFSGGLCAGPPVRHEVK
jgi:hypothetical protein